MREREGGRGRERVGTVAVLDPRVEKVEHEHEAIVRHIPHIPRFPCSHPEKSA